MIIGFIKWLAVMITFEINVLKTKDPSIIFVTPKKNVAPLTFQVGITKNHNERWAFSENLRCKLNIVG